MLLAALLLVAADPAVSTVPNFPRRPIVCTEECISPIEAVTYASYLAPKAGIAGTFKMEVKAVDEQNGFYYLNSEADYRDRNCLTIAMPATVMKRLTYGEEGLAAVEKRFKGRTITVRGVAERVKIGFFEAGGKPTDKYYYQVQIRIGQASQLWVQGDGYVNDAELVRPPAD
jgi:hypothetical protein